MEQRQDTKRQKKLKKERLKAAESVCWTLMVMMGLGGLDVPQEERDWLAGSMQKWADLAVETGIMEP